MNTQLHLIEFESTNSWPQRVAVALQRDFKKFINYLLLRLFNKHNDVFSLTYFRAVIKNVQLKEVSLNIN